MEDATVGLIELPASFWRSAAVAHALASRDMSLLLREANQRGVSQTRLGEAVGLSQGRISETLRGKRRITRLEVIERIASGLNMPPEARVLVGLAASTPSLSPTPADPLRQGQQEIDDMNRRELLRLLAVAGATLAVPPTSASVDWDRATEPIKGSVAGRAALAELSELNTHLWQLYTSASAKSSAYPLVRNQLSVLMDNLGKTKRPDERRELARLVADLFQLAGEISFDASRYTDAAQCYTLSATASKEADDFDLWACAMTRHAFLGLYGHEYGRALPMLQIAGNLARNGSRSLSTRYWVSCVEAQALAGLGDVAGFERAMGYAEGVHELSAPHNNGGWRRFDGSRIAEERGASYVSLKLPDRAEATLTAALQTALSARRRGCVLSDLAMTGAQRGDAEQVVSYGNAALEMAQRTRSGVIAQKLRTLQPQLAPIASVRDVRHLNAEISALANL
ncbi:helix-turn-helix transcriptional regulator [Kribbella solani]|uniref:helix-turn-helix transcriptional regulator n=1 Tax=Kribbella solani TaxID=236067 RepID=UPI0029AB4A1E|nr:helix-turn-helix transcriptional regulator [Kribbella solani]MDX2972308.1 helix-turn-helix transcriptional regulator [Kribbella solani]